MHAWRSVKNIFAIVFAFLSFNTAFSAEVQAYKQECADLGFKVGSMDNADCAFKLLKRSRRLEAEQRSNEVAKAHIEAERRELAYQQALIQQQQQQAYELQRRAVAAQEQAAQAQQQEADTYRFNNTMQMLMGTGAYSRPQPRAPITCTTMGAFTNCQ